MGGYINPPTVIAVAALAAMLFFAVRYIVKAKKKGNKCIGCPFCDACSKYKNK